jgi:hypothetical protein
MQGVGCADVLFVLQVPDNKADAVRCEHLRNNDDATLCSFDPKAQKKSRQPADRADGQRAKFLYVRFSESEENA